MPAEPPRPGGREDRAAAFRRRHRVGERVRGRLVRFEAPGLAWVVFDREPLLARIESSPPAGANLHFLVTSLYPEIVLKELRPGQAPAPTPPARLLQQLHAARAGFGEAARGLLAALDAIPEPPGRRAAFQAGLAANPEAAEAWLALLLAAARINVRLAPGGFRLACLPWLAPRAEEFELVARTATAAPLGEVLCSCLLPRLGRLKVQALHRRGRVAFRLALDEPVDLGRVRGIVRERLAAIMPADAECLAVEPLPPEARAGVLAELLALPADGRPGLEARA